GGATGWSTRRLPATAEPRCATSPRTSSEWQSVTTGSSPRGWHRHLHLPPRRIQTTAEDVTGRDGIPPPLPPARPARRVPEGTALRIPEPQLCDIDRGGAMDGDGAQPGKVRAAGGADRRTCRTAGAAMPLVRRPDGPPGIRAGPGTIRYELTR